MITKLIRKFYLQMYRLLGFSFLVGISGTIVVFFLLMLFFFFNASWIAPTILSPTSDRMLQFAAAFQQVGQNIETLKVAQWQAQRDVTFAKNASIQLHALSLSLNAYSATTTSVGGMKAGDIKSSYALATELDRVKDQTQKNVKAGLITNLDATQTLAAVQSFHNTATDADLALSQLRINVQAQSVQLAGQVAQSDNDILTKQETLVAATKSLQAATGEYNTLLETSYYRAYTQHGADLAFIPYDNLPAAKVGAPVYDCYLLVAACHQVGTIAKIYKDEQIVDFPIFNVRFSRTVRGVFVDMDITKPESMKSLLVFVGHKPLLF